MTSEFPFPQPERLQTHERRRRVALLLCKVVLLAEAEKMVAIREAGTRPGGAEGEIDERILNFLRSSGQATPLLIRSVLGIPRSTAYWSFLRLRRAGQIVGNGQARALVYRLNKGEPPSEKIILN